MYEVDDLDRVVPLTGVPESDTGAPLPIVLADDGNLLLGYITSTPDPKWDGSNVESVGQRSPNRSVAIVRFEREFAHFFGPPNDEAFHGHPLSDRDLGYYGAFEVIDSSWIRKLEQMNSVHPRHSRDWFMEGKRHFVFTFHDNTFECIARGYAIERVTGSLGYALDRMCELLCDSWH
jgi:hypothetical protein